MLRLTTPNDSSSVGVRWTIKDEKSTRPEIHFVDGTLRDGQEGLWATAMRTGMILPIAAQMDEAGFEAI